MSTFSMQYPEFAAIEKQVKRAQAQRAVYLASLFADAIVGTARGLRRLFGAAADHPAPATQPLVVKARLTA